MDRKNNIKNLLKEILHIKKQIEPKLVRRLKLDLLERIVIRLEDYSKACDECKGYLNYIENDISKIKDNLDILKKESLKDYSRKVKTITKHLKKKHKLVEEGEYLSLYISFGLMFGVAIGSALDNVALGPAFGLSIGAAIGVSLDANAKKEGRVI